MNLSLLICFFFLFRTTTSFLIINPSSVFTYRSNKEDHRPRNSAAGLDIQSCWDDNSAVGFAASSTSTNLLALGENLGNVGIGVVVLLLTGLAVATYIQQSVVPEQLNNLAWMVKEERPDLWDEITSKLKEGERVRDRQDLLEELTQAGLTMMKVESEDEMKKLMIMIQEQRKLNDSSSSSSTDMSREFIEATLGCTIEEFLAKVSTNENSVNLTTIRGELAQLLREEF